MSCIRSCYEKDSPNFGHEDCGTCIHGDRQPQQKQEPVAWMRKDETCTDCFVWEKTEDHTIPLYTSPPQRQPMTDEQIYSLADSIEVWNDYAEKWTLDPNTFARAIEAAHGIGKGEA